jgi:hypothetical protein
MRREISGAIGRVQLGSAIACGTGTGRASEIIPMHQEFPIRGFLSMSAVPSIILPQ